MQIIKNRALVEDSWQLLEMDQPLVEGDIIVPFERWLSEREQLLAHQGAVGVKISGGQAFSELIKELAHFDLIALDFEKFADGRGYSYARLLRERYHYSGELRAVGDVMHDQLSYMERCGINSFMLRPDQELQDALRAFDDFSAYYQTAADKVVSIQQQRHA